MSDLYEGYHEDVRCGDFGVTCLSEAFHPDGSFDLQEVVLDDGPMRRIKP